MVSNQRLKMGRNKKAKQYLEGKGIKIMATNIRTPYGELDLIGMDDSQVVFFEVKTRTSTAFGFGEQAISETKQQHLIDSAEAYMQEHSDLGDDWRIDAIIIDGSPLRNKIEIRWFKNAVSSD